MTKGTTTYHAVSDVARRMGVPREWLLHMILAGHLPKRSFGKFRVMSDEDIERARELRQTDWRERDPVKHGEEHEVGLSVALAAAHAGVGAEFVRDLAETGKIDAQRFGKSFIIFPSAVEQIKAMPQTTLRKEVLAYRTIAGNPKRIPPLDDRYKTVVRLRFEGKAFAEIARMLIPPVSRERPSKMFATAKQRVELLIARQITDVDEIARHLDIDIETAERLIALVQA